MSELDEGALGSRIARAGVESVNASCEHTHDVGMLWVPAKKQRAQPRVCFSAHLLYI